MLSSPRWIVPLMALLATGGATAQERAPGTDRCTGTLCDLYYEGTAHEKPASGAAGAPTPLMAPTSGFLGGLLGGSAQQAAPAGGSGAPAAAPPRRPLVAVQGGGLVGRMNGEPAGRCTGTLCDLFYGGPPPEEPVPQGAAMTPGEEPETAAREAPAPGRRRRTIEDAGSHCASTPGDPWRCYR